MPVACECATTGFTGKTRTHTTHPPTYLYLLPLEQTPTLHALSFAALISLVGARQTSRDRSYENTCGPLSPWQEQLDVPPLGEAVCPTLPALRLALALVLPTPRRETSLSHHTRLGSDELTRK